MKTKDIIMLGLIIGIGFFFIGAMITSVFQTTDKNYTPDKVSKTIKLIGLGIITTTCIVGGVVGDDLHKYFKLTILIVGLVLLLCFTVGAQFMKWDWSTTNYSGSYFGSGYSSSSGGPPSTPGFEIIFGIIAVGIILLVRKIKGKYKR